MIRLVRGKVQNEDGKIYSTGSCDAATREGSAEVVLECEGENKISDLSPTVIRPQIDAFSRALLMV